MAEEAPSTGPSMPRLIDGTVLRHSEVEEGFEADSNDSNGLDDRDRHGYQLLAELQDNDNGPGVLEHGNGWFPIANGNGFHEDCSSDSSSEPEAAESLSYEPSTAEAPGDSPTRSRSAEAQGLPMSVGGTESGANDAAEMACDGEMETTTDERGEVARGGAMAEMARGDAMAEMAHGGAVAEMARGDAMEMTAERKTAIVAAMKNFSLPYFPAWALHVPEEQWVGALRNPSAWQSTVPASSGDQAEAEQQAAPQGTES